MSRSVSAPWRWGAWLGLPLLGALVLLAVLGRPSEDGEPTVATEATARHVGASGPIATPAELQRERAAPGEGLAGAEGDESAREASPELAWARDLFAERHALWRATHAELVQRDRLGTEVLRVALARSEPEDPRFALREEDFAELDESERFALGNVLVDRYAVTDEARRRLVQEGPADRLLGLDPEELLAALDPTGDTTFSDAVLLRLRDERVRLLREAAPHFLARREMRRWALEAAMLVGLEPGEFDLDADAAYVAPGIVEHRRALEELGREYQRLALFLGFPPR